MSKRSQTITTQKMFKFRFIVNIFSKIFFLSRRYQVFLLEQFEQVLLSSKLNIFFAIYKIGATLVDVKLVINETDYIFFFHKLMLETLENCDK